MTRFRFWIHFPYSFLIILYKSDPQFFKKSSVCLLLTPHVRYVTTVAVETAFRMAVATDRRGCLLSHVEFDWGQQRQLSSSSASLERLVEDRPYIAYMLTLREFSPNNATRAFLYGADFLASKMFFQRCFPPRLWFSITFDGTQSHEECCGWISRRCHSHWMEYD